MEFESKISVKEEELGSQNVLWVPSSVITSIAAQSSNVDTSDDLKCETTNQNIVNNVVDYDLPDPPEEPLQSDCCGTGCSPCVFDIYDQDMKLWEKQCQRIKSGEKTACFKNTHPVISTSTYTPFTIESIHRESHDSFIYRFPLPQNTSLGLTVGQHIILRGQVNGRYITRQYTPISDLKALGYFDILIKVYPKGEMSQYVKTWRVGDILEWRGPYGTFTYKSNTYRHLLLVAAGTGIAPMVQVIQDILENEEDETFIRLVFSVKTYQDIILKDLLKKWQCYWNFTVTYVISQDPTCIGKYGEDIHIGRITEDFLVAELDKCVGSKLILICGTKSFDKDIEIQLHLFKTKIRMRNIVLILSVVVLVIGAECQTTDSVIEDNDITTMSQDDVSNDTKDKDDMDNDIKPDDVPDKAEATNIPPQIKPGFCDSVAQTGCNLTNNERCIGEGVHAGQCACIAGHVRGSDARTCVAVKTYYGQVPTRLKYIEGWGSTLNLVTVQLRSMVHQGLLNVFESSPTFSSLIISLELSGFRRSSNHSVIIEFKVHLSRTLVPISNPNEIDHYFKMTLESSASRLPNGHYTLGNVGIELADNKEMLETIVGQSSLQASSPCVDPSLNYCSRDAVCSPTMRSFICSCKDGFSDNPLTNGPPGERCTLDCNCQNNGMCRQGSSGEKICLCSGWYFGARCEINGIYFIIVGAVLFFLMFIFCIISLICCVKNKRNKRRIKTENFETASYTDSTMVIKTRRPRNSWKYYDYSESQSKPQGPPVAGVQGSVYENPRRFDAPSYQERHQYDDLQDAPPYRNYAVPYASVEPRTYYHYDAAPPVPDYRPSDAYMIPRARLSYPGPYTERSTNYGTSGSWVWQTPGSNAYAGPF
ncbi:unnamed protein product [Owenia fusiformis]|uniref:cytochrome-b5 reductase n=1 Tax=Owenia fusiformis TaxID=6347 RepID=A0A8S4MZE4_OWEFU|nr:unnamed protein product [Owenia fusiformis]